MRMRRDVLRRLVEKGEIVFVGGYSFDDLLGESRSDDMAAPAPVVLWREGTKSYDYPEGTVAIRPGEFEGASGLARVDEIGVITLRVHSNKSYDLMRKSDWEARRAAKAAATAVTPA